MLLDLLRFESTGYAVLLMPWMRAALVPVIGER
jgi:hypothetical protein